MLKVSDQLSPAELFPGAGAIKLISVAPLLNAGVFYSLLALIGLTAIPYGTVEPLWESVFEAAILALTALWILEGLISGSWHLREQLWLVPLFALIGYIWAQAEPWGNVVGLLGLSSVDGQTISADPYETRRIALKALCLILFLALLLRYTHSRTRLLRLVYVVIATGLASALFGLVRRALQNDEPGFVLSALKAGVGFGQFINPNHFAFLMEMSLGLVLCLMLSRSIRREFSLVYLAAAITMWTALILSNSRGGIFSMLAQAVLISLLLVTKRVGYRATKQKRRQKNWLENLRDSFWVRGIMTACLLVILSLGVMHVGGDSLSNRLETVSREVNTEGRRVNRLAIWQATWKLIKAHPMTGVGFGAYNIAVPQYLDSPGGTEILQAHNDYLELLANGGVLALLFCAWFAVNLIRRVRRQWGNDDPLRTALSYGAFTGLFAVAIHSLFDFGLHITINALVLIALIVIIAVNVKGRESLAGAVSVP